MCGVSLHCLSGLCSTFIRAPYWWYRGLENGQICFAQWLFPNRILLQTLWVSRVLPPFKTQSCFGISSCPVFRSKFKFTARELTRHWNWKVGDLVKFKCLGWSLYTFHYWNLRNSLRCFMGVIINKIGEIRLKWMSSISWLFIASSSLCRKVSKHVTLCCFVLMWVKPVQFRPHGRLIPCEHGLRSCLLVTENNCLCRFMIRARVQN